MPTSPVRLPDPVIERMAARTWATRVGDGLEGVARGTGLQLVWREQPAALLHLAVGAVVFLDPREDEIDDALRVLPEVARRVLLDHRAAPHPSNVRRLSVALFRRLRPEGVSPPRTAADAAFRDQFKKS